jgi:hypothetical protein
VTGVADLAAANTFTVGQTIQTTDNTATALTEKVVSYYGTVTGWSSWSGKGGSGHNISINGFTSSPGAGNYVVRFEKLSNGTNSSGASNTFSFSTTFVSYSAGVASFTGAYPPGWQSESDVVIGTTRATVYRSNAPLKVLNSLNNPIAQIDGAGFITCTGVYSTGDAAIDGRLYVGGKLSVAGSLSIGGSLSLSSNLSLPSLSLSKVVTEPATYTSGQIIQDTKSEIAFASSDSFPYYTVKKILTGGHYHTLVTNTITATTPSYVNNQASIRVKPNSSVKFRIEFSYQKTTTSGNLSLYLDKGTTNTTGPVSAEYRTYIRGSTLVNEGHLYAAASAGTTNSTTSITASTSTIYHTIIEGTATNDSTGTYVYMTPLTTSSTSGVNILTYYQDTIDTGTNRGYI